MLSAFINGYDGVLLGIDIHDNLPERYHDIPSLEDFARQKYHGYEIGSRNFISLLAWLSEDSRDLFYRYIAFLKEYEATFPLKSEVCWVLRENPITLKILLSGIRRRYRMYFANNDLSYLRAFLDGYFLCKHEYHLPLDEFEKQVQAFIHNIECKDFSAPGQFVTWDRKFRYELDGRPWGMFDDDATTRILTAFWSEMEKFTGSLSNSVPGKI